jgi:long-chain acyl-CoA synthetase
VFLKDGWFSTGDVGQINADGTISIIDRKKNMIKLSHGEYIALEKLESVYGNSSFVAPNSVWVYGDQFASFVVAVVVPQQSYTEQWAKQNGIKYANFAELCSNPKLRKAVLRSLQEEAKKKHLTHNETLRDLRLSHDEWTPESSLLTAAMKLKRPQLKKRFQAEIAEMYS